jgi:hypothetical protein
MDRNVLPDGSDDRRMDAADPADPDNLVERPITSPSAVEHARRLLALGLSDVQERSDGRLWALGPDRRSRPRT